MYTPVSTGAYEVAGVALWADTLLSSKARPKRASAKTVSIVTVTEFLSILIFLSPYVLMV
jgi:hypothetical protein